MIKLDKRFKSIFLVSSCAVGLLLDKTGSGTSQSNAGCNFLADPFDATREESSVIASCVISKGRGRVHVSLHGLRVHGVDGVLPGEHRSRRLGYASETGASASTAIFQRHRFCEAR